ncbi:MAG TPA: nicotinate (nicotinamide) nucleotide adenylyltransferase [Flavitalea sp.]|nr:nicotinate (nicotinamide) nucleotide adenylyltransferase [Flavitalea sp.]
MKIGLYFGSFNPIHTGHCIIANHVLANTQLEQVWFIVSPQNPLKSSAGLLNEYHRLHLVQLAVEAENGLRVNDIEFRLPKPSYTVDTLSYLQEKYPHHSFSVIMGSDSFKNLPKWKNYFHIIQHYPIYVYVRTGHEEISFYPNADITTLKAPLLGISSTLIRKNVKEGKSIRYLVPDKVLEEITRNGYYRN